MEQSCVRAARAIVLLAAACLGARPAFAASTPQQETQQPAQARPTLGQLVVEGATVYSRDDVFWLLDLREGSVLPKDAPEIASALQDRYARDGYTEARVDAKVEGSTLTLRVDEGRIDEIELLGVSEQQASTLRDRLGVKPGDIYNKRTIGNALDRLVESTRGALTVARPRATAHPSGTPPPDDVVVERRGGTNVLVVPLRWRRSHANLTAGTEGREDIFSPVDGLSPALGFTATIFDHARFNHTLIDANASYKFGREDLGYSAGLERPVFASTKLYLGAELHDLTTSDDMWRLLPAEQTLVSLAFKNSFRDYYRRHGAQLFSVLQAGPNNELTLMARWDRHQPLENATDYSFFRDDETAFRPNPLIADQQVNAWILGYTFDTRPLSGAGERRTYQRHLRDSPFGFGLRQQPGLRLDWTSELAGRGLGGDATFDRHIVNLRGYLAFTDRQLLAARGIVGGSQGDLPIERRFSLGGIGTVHGYRFKEEAGTGMTLVNAEYRVRLSRPFNDNEGVSVFGFYDAGRVTGPLDESTGKWLQGIGFGVGVGTLRVEFGFRANDIPSSRQVLVRLGPTF